MAPDPAAVEAAPPDTKPDKEKDPVASLCGQVPLLPTGDRAALRRLYLTRSEMAAGIVTGLLLRAGVPHADALRPATFARWQLLAHVAAVLSGTAAVPPHHPGAGLGRALHEADYSDHRLMRLTSARGPALVDQIVRAARVLASAGKVPVNFHTLRDLSLDTALVAEAARLRIARDYYATKHASTKDAS
jgi:CRISPR type I-E-associated protein CasB/Cse2